MKMHAIASTTCILVLIYCGFAPTVEGATCVSNPCQNGGNCTDGVCECAMGWIGNQCQHRLHMGPGNFSCVNVTPCINGGTCQFTFCQCEPGWAGIQCQRKKRLVLRSRVFVQEFGDANYTLHTSTKSYELAMEDCIKIGAILAHSVPAEVRKEFQDDFGKSSPTLVPASLLEDDWYWTLVNDNITNSPYHAENATCPLMNLSGQNTSEPCNETNPFICSRRTEGKCHPIVKEKECAGEHGVCELSLTGVTCNCDVGYNLTYPERRCEDIDECAKPRTVCTGIRATCQNSVGSYSCGCPARQQGNGIDVCGYVVTMAQDIDIDAVGRSMVPKLPFGNESKVVEVGQKAIMVFLNTAVEKIVGKVSKFITKILVKQVSNTSGRARVIYDVYSKDSNISPSSIREFYMEASRRDQLGPIRGGIPEVAPPLCTPTKLGMGRKIYNFPPSLPGLSTPSNEKCPNGRQIASASCKTKTNYDGTTTAYYDYTSLIDIDCGVTVAAIAQQVENWDRMDLLQGATKALYSLTSDVYSQNKKIFQDAAKSIKAIANYVRDTKAEITVSTMTSIINAANNINRQQKLERATNGSQQMNATEKTEIAMALIKCSTHTKVDPQAPVTITSQYVTLQVTNVTSTHHNVRKSRSMRSNGIRFGVASKTEPTFQSRSASNCATSQEPTTGLLSFVPLEAVEQASESDDLHSAGHPPGLPVSFVYFRDSEFFPVEGQDFQIDQVLSATVADVEVRDLNNPVWFQMPASKNTTRSKQEVRFYRCCYLDPKTGEWLSDGCSIVPGSDPPNCTCNHMTNFAIIVRTHTFLKEYTLEIVGTVCCLISIIGLFLMLAINLYFPSLRESMIVQIHSNLGFCLCVAYVVLLAWAERPRSHGSCLAVAASLQFFLLASWGWMIVECVTMYRKFVQIWRRPGKHYVMKSACIVYLSSALAVALTLVISVGWYDTTHNQNWVAEGSANFPSSYISDRFCWLHSYSLICGFLLPIGICFVINLIGSILILRAITWGRTKVGSTSAANKDDANSYLLRTVVVSVLLGLSWAFAIPLTFTDDPHVNNVFGWLFSITNALQGFLLFMLLCVRRDDVRGLWIHALRSTFRHSSEETSQSGEAHNAQSGTSTAAQPSPYPIDTRPTLFLVPEIPPTSDHNAFSLPIAAEQTSKTNNYRLRETSSFNPKGLSQ